MQVSKAYIVAGLRTAGGRRGGRLSGWHPVDLGAAVLNGLISKARMDPALIDDVLFGCVGQVNPIHILEYSCASSSLLVPPPLGLSQAGEQSFNVARNCVLASNLPESVPATSIDRQCGSSQQAVHFAAQAVRTTVPRTEDVADCNLCFLAR